MKEYKMKTFKVPINKEGTSSEDDRNRSCRKLEELTGLIGSGGKWQVKLLFLSIFIQMFSAFHHLALSFLAYPVDHWCARPEGSDISLDIWWIDFLPNATLRGFVHHSQCEEYIFNNLTTAPEDLVAIPCTSWEYSSEFNSVLNTWNVVCEKEWLLSISQSTYMLGCVCAAMISGQLSDMYGRQLALMLNVFIFSLSSIAVNFANSFIMFCAFRFFVAVGLVGMDLAIYIILIENTGTERRLVYSILSNMGWHIGYVLLPLIAWLFMDWFFIQLAISLPSLLFISFYWIVPESPRWLLLKGKKGEALPVIQNAAWMNKILTDDLAKKIETICSNLEEQRKESKKVTILDLLKTPQLRKRTLSLYLIWIMVNFTYYGLCLNTNDLPGNIFVNFALSGAMEFPATLFCIATMDRFGRKKPFMFSLISGGIFCFACTFLAHNLSLTIILSMIGKLFVSACYCMVYIYSAEIFPTVARNIGVGSCLTMARFGSSLAPFMKDLAKVTGLSVTMSVFGGTLMFCVCLLMLLPETSKFSIPDTLKQAENFGKKEESPPKETFKPILHI